MQETRNAEDGKIFHYPLSVPLADGENLVGVFEPNQKEMLPSFGRFLVRDQPDAETSNHEDDVDLSEQQQQHQQQQQQQHSNKNFYSRDSGKTFHLDLFAG